VFEASSAGFSTPSRWRGGEGGRTGDRMAKDEKILVVTCWGWGVVQNVQEPNLHYFDHFVGHSA